MIELHPVCSMLPELLPPDSKYFEMSLFENDLDRRINHKQLQIADASFKITKAKRNLVVFVSHQISEDKNESGITAGINLSPSTKSWIVRIEGKLEGYGRKINKKFTSFFKKIIIDINDGSDLIEWNLSAAEQQHLKGMENDGFEIKRRFPFPNSTSSTFPNSTDTSSPNSTSSTLSLVNLKIFLYPSHQTDRFKLSDPLSLLLGMKNACRPQIIVSLWQYIKIHKLQESDEKKSIVNDDALRNLFGVEKMSFTDLPALIEPHLLPEEPFVINYSIPFPFLSFPSKMESSNVNGNNNESNINDNENKDKDKDEENSATIENIEVELEDVTRAKTANPTIISLTREIGALDQKMIEVVNALKHSKATINVLEEFSRDPREWLLQALKRQTKDYQVILGDARINIEDARQSKYYNDYWDLVKIYSKLNK